MGYSGSIMGIYIYIYTHEDNQPYETGKRAYDILFK